MYIPESPRPMRNPAPLDRVPGLTPNQLETLAQHWIISIQELVALAEMPSTQKHLAQLLDMEVEDLSQLAQTARGQLATMRGEEDDEETWEDIEYASGALWEPPALRAERTYERIPYEAPLPQALSYADELPPIRNQGTRGTCVAYAAAAVREFMEIQQQKRLGNDIQPKTVDFSEQFIYWWCKEHDGLPSVSGTYPHLGMTCLVEAGVPREKTWPYNPLPQPDNEGQGPPPDKALKEAPRYRIGRVIHLRPDDIDSMKAALVQGKSVMITIPIVNSWFRSRTTRRFGKINVPLPDEKPMGAHAMAIIGYVDDDTAPGGGYFILRNAWRPWALKNPLGPGLATIPYAFIRQHNSIAAVGVPLIAADVFLRDNDTDTGQVPTRGMTFNSPDIWVRQHRDGGEAHEPVIPGKTHWIYVRAHNLGPEPATQVRAQVFEAPASPSLWPEMWQEVGEVEVGEMDAGAEKVVVLAWKPRYAHPRLLVRLDSAEDPAQHVWAVRYDNNIAQKNVVMLQARAGETVTFTFPLYGPKGTLTLRNLRVNRRNFRRGRVRLTIDRGDVYRRRRAPNEDKVLQQLASQPPVQRNATLTLQMHPQATPKDGGTLVITQMHDQVLVGRMQVVVQVVEEEVKPSG